MIETGTMARSDVILSLYRAYIDMSDEQLKERNVSRDDVLWLARHFEGEMSEYRRTELNTIANQILTAFRAGQAK